jgi:hypothetical protein
MLEAMGWIFWSVLRENRELLLLWAYSVWLILLSLEMADAMFGEWD